MMSSGGLFPNGIGVIYHRKPVVRTAGETFERCARSLAGGGHVDLWGI